MSKFSNEDKNYDLEERTQKFGENIIEFAKEISKNTVTNPIISQLVRSGTSVGANYMEANGADSKKDFVHKIGISKREAKETKHWLRMIVKAEPSLKEKAIKLWKEAEELNLIFSKIVRSSKK
jgi:four helix bundle protein